MNILFVGIQPSYTAYQRRWTWQSGRMCAKNLFLALRQAGINPEQCCFTNLFSDRPNITHKPMLSRIQYIQSQASEGWSVVALGNKVARVLHQYQIPHTKLRHPAARGNGRRQEIYSATVATTLDRMSATC